MSAPAPGGTDGPGAHGRFVVVPAAYVFLLRGEQQAREVLLQLRQHTGFMDGHYAAAAAGHVERGEDAVAAARREAREEVGVDVGPLRFLTAMHRTAHGEPIDERIDFFFATESWSGEPRVVEPTKNAGLCWCPLDALTDLPHPVVPHERVVLDSLAAGTMAPYTTFGFDPRPERQQP